MKSTGIKEILEQFVSNSSFQFVLIDGPWGCGKTYAVEKFITSHKKIPIYYVSMFGIKSIDEINLRLYQQSRKKTIFAKKTLMFACKAIKAIPNIGGIGDALDFQLGQMDNSKLKGKTLIVLDDLERLSSTVSFIELLGYMNELSLSQCKIVCLISSLNLDEEKRKTFNDFKEKAFDHYYQISETDNSVFSKIFSEYGKYGIDSAFPLFNKNYRMAIKTEHFFHDILDLFNDKRIDISKSDISYAILLKACALAVDICFSTKTFSSEVKYENEQFSGACDIYGVDVANGLYWYKFNCPGTRSLFTLSIFSNMVVDLCSSFMYRDYDDLISLLTPKSSQQNFFRCLIKIFTAFQMVIKKNFLRNFLVLFWNIALRGMADFRTCYRQFLCTLIL
jgi:hypothetical protein